MRLVYRPSALSDLDFIYDAIEPDNPRRAASYVDDIRSRCRTLCDHPLLGPARDDIKRGLRIYPMFGRVVVCYRVEVDVIVVMRVLYGGRDYVAVIASSDDEV